MKRHGWAVATIAVALAACAQLRIPGMGWETLVDGEKGMENFNAIGDANWHPEGGAIVDVAAVPVPITNTAGGKWNTYEITAKGSQLTVRLNGVQTASVQDSKHASGPFALQMGPGVKGAQGGPIKWRKVQIRPL